MSAPAQDTERTAVKTYVPAYQRDEWDEHAAELDMSRSEFVRSMVQAGRKGFDPRGDTPETGESDGTDSEPDRTPVASDFESVVRESLDSGPSSWDDLFQAVSEDLEAQLEATLERMQERNEIRYSGPDGGYVPVE